MHSRLSRRLARLAGAIHPELEADRKIAEHAREYIVPNPPKQADAKRNMPATRLDPPGLDLREAEQLALLLTFRTEQHAKLFAALREDAKINRLGHGDPRVSNIFFNTPDAEIYASMILARRPKKLVEVGSGYSTLVARKAIEFAGLDTKIVVTDPWPRTDVTAVSDEVRKMPVEQTALLNETWSPGDIFFIDSSHITRTRGDLPFLFCQVLPALPPGVRVHVHDIFLPYDYPNLYDAWAHTEEYLLACMLSHSTRYRVVMANHWLSRDHPEAMNATFGPWAGSEKSSPDHFGASFWFDVV